MGCQELVNGLLMQPVETSQAIVLVMSYLQDDDDEAEDILLPFQEASVQHVEGASRLSRRQPSLVRRCNWLTWAHCPADRHTADAAAGGQQQDRTALGSAAHCLSPQDTMH